MFGGVPTKSMRSFYADGDATHWPAGSCRAHAGGRRVSADGDATVASETNSLLLPCGSKQWRARCNQSSKSMHAFSLALIWSRSDSSDRPPPRSHPAPATGSSASACLMLVLSPCVRARAGKGASGSRAPRAPRPRARSTAGSWARTLLTWLGPLCIVR